MAKASQQYCRFGSCWNADIEKHDSGELGFLQKLLTAGSRCVSGRLVEAMRDSISSLCLVRECRELKDVWCTLH